MNPSTMAWAWKQRLSRVDKRLLFALVDCADGSGLIRYVPVPQLAAKTGLEPRHVHQALGRLIAARVIQWLDSDCYRLNLGSDSPSPDDRTPPQPVQAKVPTVRESVVVYLKALFR
jgi:hypothetical protein